MSSTFCSKSCRYKCKNKDWCAKDYNPELDNYECFEPMTNADRIRAFSVEELAEFLAKNQKIGNVEQCGNGYRQLWLDWLRQEVDGDG